MATRTKYKDLADAEEARLEAGEDTEDEDGEDTDTEDENEAGDEAESSEGATAEPVELPSLERFQKLMEAEGKRHLKALEGMFGDDFASFEECPLCHLLGVVTPQDMVLDPDTIQCDKCRGWGQLVTEASAPEHRFRQCPKCMGNCYVEKPIEYTPVQVAETPPPNGQPAPIVIPPMPYYDAQAGVWRTPEGQPLVGMAG